MYGFSEVLKCVGNSTTWDFMQAIGGDFSGSQPLFRPTAATQQSAAVNGPGSPKGGPSGGGWAELRVDAATMAVLTGSAVSLARVAENASKSIHPAASPKVTPAVEASTPSGILNLDPPAATASRIEITPLVPPVAQLPSVSVNLEMGSDQERGAARRPSPQIDRKYPDNRPPPPPYTASSDSEMSDRSRASRRSSRSSNSSSSHASDVSTKSDAGGPSRRSRRVSHIRQPRSQLVAVNEKRRMNVTEARTQRALAKQMKRAFLAGVKMANDDHDAAAEREHGVRAPNRGACVSCVNFTFRTTFVLVALICAVSLPVWFAEQGTPGQPIKTTEGIWPFDSTTTMWDYSLRNKVVGAAFVSSVVSSVITAFAFMLLTGNRACGGGN